MDQKTKTLQYIGPVWLTLYNNVVSHYTSCMRTWIALHIENSHQSFFNYLVGVAVPLVSNFSNNNNGFYLSNEDIFSQGLNKKIPITSSLSTFENS